MQTESIISSLLEYFAEVQPILYKDIHYLRDKYDLSRNNLTLNIQNGLAHNSKLNIQNSTFYPILFLANHQNDSTRFSLYTSWYFQWLRHQRQLLSIAYFSFLPIVSMPAVDIGRTSFFSKISERMRSARDMSD